MLRDTTLAAAAGRVMMMLSVPPLEGGFQRSRSVSTVVDKALEAAVSPTVEFSVRRYVIVPTLPVPTLLALRVGAEGVERAVKGITALVGIL
jgi:hypothetical protein